MATAAVGKKVPGAYCSTFQPGDRIEAQVSGYIFWFPGTIARRNDDKGTSYEIHFDDGDVDLQVPFRRIRYPAHAEARRRQKEQAIAFLAKTGGVGGGASPAKEDVVQQPNKVSASSSTTAESAPSASSVVVVPENLDPLGLGRSADAPSPSRSRARQRLEAAIKTDAETRPMVKPTSGTTAAVNASTASGQTQQLGRDSGSNGASYRSANTPVPGEGIDVLSQPVTDFARVKDFLDLVRADDSTQSAAVQRMMLQMLSACAVVARDYDTARHTRHAASQLAQETAANGGELAVAREAAAAARGKSHAGTAASATVTPPPAEGTRPHKSETGVDDEASFASNDSELRRRAELHRARMMAARATQAAEEDRRVVVESLRSTASLAEPSIQEIFNTMSNVDLHIQRLQNSAPDGFTAQYSEKTNKKASTIREHLLASQELAAAGFLEPRSGLSKRTIKQKATTSLHKPPAARATTSSRTVSLVGSVANYGKMNAQNNNNLNDAHAERPRYSASLKKCLNPGCDSKWFMVTSSGLCNRCSQKNQLKIGNRSRISIRRPTPSQTHPGRRGINHDDAGNSQGSHGSRRSNKSARSASLIGKPPQMQTSHKAVVEGKVGGKPASKPYFPAPQSPGAHSEDGSEFTPVLSGDAHVDVTVFDADNDNASLSNRSSSSATRKQLVAPSDDGGGDGDGDGSEQFDHDDSESGAGSKGSQGIGGTQRSQRSHQGSQGSRGSLRGTDHRPSSSGVTGGGGSIGSHAGSSKSGNIAQSGGAHAKTLSTVASGKFTVGDIVEAKYGGESNWYSGRIKKVNPTGTFDVEYDDGDAEESVPGGDIRRRVQSDASIASNSGGQKLEQGARVQALYGGGKDWYSGQITKVNATGTFDIEYDDGDAEESVPGDDIRFHPQEEASRGRRDGDSHSGGETASNV